MVKRSIVETSFKKQSKYFLRKIPKAHFENKINKRIILMNSKSFIYLIHACDSIKMCFFQYTHESIFFLLSLIHPMTTQIGTMILSDIGTFKQAPGRQACTYENIRAHGFK